MRLLVRPVPSRASPSLAAPPPFIAWNHHKPRKALDKLSWPPAAFGRQHETTNRFKKPSQHVSSPMRRGSGSEPVQPPTRTRTDPPVFTKSSATEARAFRHREEPRPPMLIKMNASGKPEWAPIS